MPSLNDILHDTFVVIANDDNLDGLPGGDPTNITPSKPTPGIAGPPDQSIWYWEKAPGGSDASDPGYLGQVTHVNCWARWMAESHQDDNLGWMTVCNSITWSPVQVDVKRGNSPYRLTLPLTEKYAVKTVFFAGGHNPGKGWWPLEADVDSSFFQVFVYDITGKTSKDDPDPVPKDVYEHDDFMPDPGTVGTIEPPALSPGDQVDLTAAHKQYVCVVMSLVCCKERADWEPGALVNMARFVPHFMVMTNLPLDAITATIRLDRPDESGYYGTSSEAGRPPMQHHDMDPPMKAIAAADTNVYRATDLGGVLSVPFWDMIFDFVIEAPGGQFITLNDSMKVVKDEPNPRTLPSALGLLDYERVAKAVRGAATAEALAAVGMVVVPPLVIATPVVAVGAAVAGAEGGSLIFERPGLRVVHPGPTSKLSLAQVKKLYGDAGLRSTDLLPRKMADVVKAPRQGQFDSIHIAPRMKADLLLARSDMNMPAWVDTLSEIRMAPFCEHDCMHTHWRWGANWDDARMNFPVDAFKLLKNPTSIKGFSGEGASGKFSGVGVPYTQFGAPMVPLNQEVAVAFESEHAFKYTATAAKDIVPGVWQIVFHHASGYALSVKESEKGKVDGLINLLTACPLDGVDPQWSEFYWTLRYQDAVDGPLERIEIADADLMRLMGL
jgi:hypothetical protein